MKAFKKFIAFDIIVFVLLILIFNSKIEFIKAGTIDESFKAEVTKGKYGENVIQGEITDVKQQPDGRLIIAGNFIYFNNDSSNKHIIRIFPDGAIDTSFHSAFQFERSSDIISTILIQDSGELLVGGRFESVEGRSVSNFVRLLPNGRLDKTFNKKVLAYGHLYCGNEIPPVLHSIFKLDNRSLLLTGDLSEYDSHYVFMEPVIIDMKGELRNKNFKITDFKYLESYSPIITNERFNLQQKFRDYFYTRFVNSYDNNVIGINSIGKLIIFGGEGIIAINQNGTLDSTFQLIPMYSNERGVLPKKVSLNYDFRRTTSILLPDDKVLVCGKSYHLGINGEKVPEQIIIARYLSNGKLDPSFKLDTSYLTEVSGSFFKMNTALFSDLDRKLIIGNRRFNSDGSLDNSFLLPFDRGYKVFIDSKDSYLIAKENVLYKVSKYPKINFFDLFSITLN